MRHRLAGHAHNPAVLVRDTDKDQATVQVGHRRGALGDRRCAALLEVDGQLLGSCHGHQVPDQFESDIGGGTVQQGLPSVIRKASRTAMPTACLNTFKNAAAPARRRRLPAAPETGALRFSWSGIMVTMNGDDTQDADQQHLAGSGDGEPPGAHDEDVPAKRPEFRLLTVSDSGEVADDPQDQLALSVARNLAPQLQAAFTQQLQPVLDAFRVQFADSIGQTLALQLELIIAPQLEVFRELARSVMPRLIELQPLNLLTDLLPPNWKDVPDLDIETVIGIVLDEGIPLVWVPRPAIVTELISAADADTRDGILSSSRDDIALDCLAVIGEITDAKLKPLAGLAAEAVTALQAGHSSSAQALAGNVFDTLLRAATRRGMIFVVHRLAISGTPRYGSRSRQCQTTQ